jgi:polysaccharide biosynthesis/export protein
MTKKLIYLVLLSCTFCAGQTNLNVPADQSDQTPTVPAQPPSAMSIQAPAISSKLLKVPKVANRMSGASSLSESDQVAGANVANPSRRVGPISDLSDFELFAEDAAGHPLKVYGRQLFDEAPSTFAPAERTPVPANYVVGPGDELLIRVWGKVDLDAQVTVDRNGQVSLPTVGILNVAGLRYDELEGYFRKAVGILYKGFELNVTLGQLRSIQIFVLGSARQPGAYTVSSLSTLINALFVSGGPSATGTMRRIQLRRGDHVITDFDIYNLLRKGDKSHDVPLLPGDVIYIPPVGPQVAIVDNVNEPGVYELNGETSIASALESAGGLTSLAGVDRVLLERIEDHRRRRVDEFALDAAGLQRMLKDGDLLKISSISPKFENAVMIRGNVATRGRFPWHDGMRVSDLIPSRDVLVTNDHWNQQNHLADERHSDMMTDIALTNAEINWDYAVIERLDEHDLSTRLIPFNLGNAIDSPASADNQILKIDDVVTVFSRRDLPLPLERHETFIEVGGEVNVPGVYRVNPGETLRDVVGRAGGFTQHSYLFASQLTRVSARAIEEEQLKLSIGRIQKELLSQHANAPRTARNASGGETSDNQQMQLGMQEALAAQLGTVVPTGRVVLGIRPDASTVQDIPDFPLEDGDRFYVPPRLGTVQVAGEVYNANAFRYQVNKPLYEYLEDSGGASRQADVKRIFLIRADGTVVSRQDHQHRLRNFEKIALMPGDAIVVPPKLKGPGGFMEELPLISQIISQTAMTGAVLSIIP